MAKESHSVEFCGIKLVRWGYRPRRAVRVYQGNYAVALNPNGSVAVSADSPFEYRYSGKPWLNRRLAEDLRDIKAISDLAFREHIKLCDVADLARKRRDAVDEIERAAEIIGLRLTKAQRTKLKKAA
jgi:hypothetical protein